jgi:hypothetical protein
MSLNMKSCYCSEAPRLKPCGINRWHVVCTACDRGTITCVTMEEAVEEWNKNESEQAR